MIVEVKVTGKTAKATIIVKGVITKSSFFNVDTKGLNKAIEEAIKQVVFSNYDLRLLDFNNTLSTNNKTQSEWFYTTSTGVRLYRLIQI